MGIIDSPNIKFWEEDFNGSPFTIISGRQVWLGQLWRLQQDAMLGEIGEGRFPSPLGGIPIRTAEKREEVR
jgi:hypothetical protein